MFLALHSSTFQSQQFPAIVDDDTLASSLVKKLPNFPKNDDAVLARAIECLTGAIPYFQRNADHNKGIWSEQLVILRQFLTETKYGTRVNLAALTVIDEIAARL